MKLHAGCEITVEAEDDCPCVAMLRPRSGEAQWLSEERYAFEPRVEPTEYVDVYGNLCQRFVAPRGRLTIRAEAVVEVADTLRIDERAARVPIPDLPQDTLQYLLQSRYCPSDKVKEEADRIVGRAKGGYTQVEAIRAWIHDKIDYRYGVSNASTDAFETLQLKAGVCRDFSHVGITLCRSLGIPARMVVGYLHELDPMDLHAWFEAYIGGRWVTFDATQDRPRGGRIVIAYGRDAADVAIISNYGPLQTRAMNVFVTVEPPARRAATRRRRP